MEHQQLYLPFPNNNQFKNGNKKAFESIEPDKNSNFCTHKLTEVAMVNKKENLIFATIQIVVLSFKIFDNCQELLVISLIAIFGRDLFLREKGYKVLLTNFALRKIWILVGYVIGRTMIQSYLT